MKLSYEIKSNYSDEFQVFYKSSSNDNWTEENSIKKKYINTGKFENLEFNIPKTSRYIRIDLGNSKTNMQIRDTIIFGNNQYSISDLGDSSLNELEMRLESNEYYISTLGEDPYIEYFINNDIYNNMYADNIFTKIVKVIVSIMFAGIVCFILLNVKIGILFIKDTLITGRGMIVQLAKNDFKTKYISSYLGAIWGFIQPLVLIGTYWFVFQIGFRSTDIGDVPYILWFICGIIPWFFFSESLGSSTNCLIEYNYLVKKVVFNIEILPIVKVMSALFVHLFFIGFMLFIYVIYGLDFSLTNIQIIYYLICTIALVISLGILTSSIVLFFRDLNQIITMILNVGFWFTPIAWSHTMLSEKILLFFKLNPMYYIVQGYRDSFIDKIWFFERPYQTVYFWVIVLLIFTIGIKLFKKLKPHFSDVL